MKMELTATTTIGEIGVNVTSAGAVQVAYTLYGEGSTSINFTPEEARFVADAILKVLAPAAPVKASYETRWNVASYSQRAAWLARISTMLYSDSKWRDISPSTQAALTKVMDA